MRRPIAILGALAMILTAGGVVNAAGSAGGNPVHPTKKVYVDLTSTQRISGIKTFVHSINGNITGVAHKAVTFTGALHGDVSGTQNNTTVTKLQGVPILKAAPSIGQMLSFNGHGWAAASLGVPEKAISFTGALHGDVSGTQNNTIVTKLQGVPILNGAPSIGQMLSFNGHGWAAASLRAPVKTVSFTGGLRGDVSGTQNHTTVAKIQGVSVSSAMPSAGQMLTFNGQQWAATSPPKAAAPDPLGPAVNTSRIAVGRNYQKNLTAYDRPAGPNPHGLAYDGAHLWVADNGGGVSRVTLFDGSRTPMYFPVLVGGFCAAVALTYDGSRIWVLCGDGSAGGPHLVALGGNLNGTLGAGGLTQHKYKLYGVSSPDAIAFDGTRLWIANEGSGNLTIVGDAAASNIGGGGGEPEGDILCGLDPSDPQTAPYGDYGPPIGLAAPHTAAGQGAGPTALVFDGANMWVANGNSNQVARIPDKQVNQMDAACPAAAQYFDVPSGPAGLTVADGNIWVVSDRASTLTEIASQNGTGRTPWNAMKPIQMNNVGPHYIIFDGNDLWISTEQGYVYEYNPFSTATPGNPDEGYPAPGFVNPAPRIPLTASGQPDQAMGLAFDGTNIWVARKNAGAVRML
jgi:hypothetical protein